MRRRARESMNPKPARPLRERILDTQVANSSDKFSRLGLLSLRRLDNARMNHWRARLRIIRFGLERRGRESSPPIPTRARSERGRYSRSKIPRAEGAPQ